MTLERFTRYTQYAYLLLILGIGVAGYLKWNAPPVVIRVREIVGPETSLLLHSTSLYTPNVQFVEDPQ
jgi:hypothetical protein